MSDHIREFWDSQAETHGLQHDASWGDSHAIELEIQTIGGYLQAGQDVLDVGCANGFATIAHLSRDLASMTGVDFSSSMIDQAQKRREELGNPTNLSFDVGDVRELPYGDELFDVVYTTRTLINLPTWADQVRGIDECLRVCRPGGTVILCEAFWEPLNRLNGLRALTSQPPLVEHDFNRYLKKSRLVELLGSRGLEHDNVDFSSIYYLGSRFLRELVTVASDYEGYSNPINKIFYDIEREFSGGDLGIQQAFVVTKT